MLDLFKIAIINLKEKKVRSWLTLVGIFIGIAAVVGLIGLGEGLRTAISSQFGVTTTEVLTIQAGGIANAGPPGTGVVNPLTLDDAKAIEKVSNVDAVIPRLIRGSLTEFNKVLSVGFLASMPDKEKRKIVEEIINLETTKGRLLKDGDTNRVVIGSSFDSDSNSFDKRVSVGDKLLINNKPFEVVGIMKKQGSFILDNAIIMNEEPMRDLLDDHVKVDIIVAKINDKNLMDASKNDIEKVLRDRRDVKVGEEDFSVETPQALLASLDKILFGIQIFIVIIAAISILVGVIGIVNTMFTAVLERRPQIGIMKAIGAKNRDIFFIFFFESGMLGLIGGIIGVILGSLGSYFGTVMLNSFIGSTSAPTISFMLIFGALMGSFIIGSVAGIVPALRAANHHPVESLRG